MKKTLQSSFLLILSIAAIAISACNKKSAPLPTPTLEINPVITDLTSTTVTVRGRYTTANIITENGFCFSATNHTPTTSDIVLTDTVGAHWKSKITALVPGQTYYFRAYAKNDDGVGYSDVLTVTMPLNDAVPTGTVTTFVGSPFGTGDYVDGVGTAASLDGPQNIAFNPVNNLLYVSDSYNNAIRTIDLNGSTSTLYKSEIGYADGTLSQAQFYGPRGISFDATGNAYVADLGNNLIRKISTTGTVSTIAGNTIPGYVDGDATKAEFFNPTATTTDATGNVYVADRTNNLIRKITPAGVVSSFSGYLALAGYSQTSVPGYLNGGTGVAEYNYPVAVATGPDGNFYVGDYKNAAIRMITPAGDVTTAVGGLYYPDMITGPAGVTLDAQGNMFIVDSDGRILEVTSKKVMYVLAGASKTVGYQNGVGAVARFSNPQSIAVDKQGNLYVADYNNNVIRKITIAVQ
jgi:sugar lactone lactonase YvrE